MVKFDDIKKLASLLDDVPVILYPLCAETIYITAKLKQFFDKKPAFVCDKNPVHCGRQTDFGILGDMEITSLSDALNRLPNSKIYITSNRLKFNILGSFIEQGITNEQIVNYEPVEKRLSCLDLNCNIVLSDSHLSFCCMSPISHPPKVDFDGNYDISLGKLENLRQQLEDNASNGCDGCVHRKYDFYPIGNKITSMNFSSGGRCNLNCSYCSSAAKDSNAAVSGMDISRIASDMNCSDIHLSVANGEITISPEKDQIISIAEIFGITNYFTNACVFNEEIKKQLDNGKAILTVSVDAGTSETYKTVKGALFFGRVCSNLLKYSGEHGYVVALHYIIIPGVNDDAENINGFIDIAKQIKTICVYLSNDFHDKSPYPHRTREVVKMFIQELKKAKIYGLLSEKNKRCLEDQ